MNKKGKILVVDDEANLRLLLNKELTRAGYSVDVVNDGEEALKVIREGEEIYHVVLLDIAMPKKDGISVLRTLKKENIPSEVIILTGNATVESAIECMKLGAFEYIKKPYSLQELLIHIERAISHQRTQNDMQILRRDLNKRFGSGIIGSSTAMKDLRKIISRIAPTQSTVLILGESGSGKELVARAIHEESQNRDKPFVAINCASLSETLLESELFGYEKGAFTDAKTQKRGLAEIADGGTLFLDEIGEIPMHFQAKLLRFLETGEIRRVGGTKDIRLDVRILCATNKPLEKLVGQGEFRADLYYRLNVLSITVPPLRDHREDIPLLVKSIIEGQAFNKEFDQKATAVLMGYMWPGNVRELKNVIERSCVLCNGPVVAENDLSFLNVAQTVVDQKPSLPRREHEYSAIEDDEVVSLEEMERRHIVRILKHVHGHKAKAALLLKINPKTLYYKMREYNIITDFK
ncbi:MAG: sigma-54-dependent Fis family transcriptional regulator [Chitinivibrionales bacterium]|nr:sigma-54-dependent Fis family transcriptional regulator [Chitinivibrionales bacterium]